MKQKIPIHVYLNREYLGKYPSILEASNRAGVQPQTIRQIILGNQPCTRKGFFFSLKKLTDEQVDELPIRDTLPTKDGYVEEAGRSCRKLVEKQVYEVDCQNPIIFHQPRNKQERINRFKNFLFTKLHDRWMIVPKPVATLERQYIRETLSSLE